MTLAPATLVRSTKNVVEGNMSDKKAKPSDMTQDVLLADTMLRLTALEKVLVAKNLVTKDELKEMTDILVEKVTKVIMDKVESSKNLDDFVTSLGKDIKKELKN
jgi:hypothetical protein